MSEIFDVKAHYFALCRSPVDGSYFVTNHLYHSEAEAREWIGMSFHALWKEGPSIPLRVTHKRGPSTKIKLTDEQTKMFEE